MSATNTAINTLRFLDDDTPNDKAYQDIANAFEEVEGRIDTIEGRISGDVSIMGTRFVDNGSTFVATRYGLTKGATNVQSTSGNITYNEVYLADGTTKIDDLPIFKQMRRGIFDNNGVLVHDQDALEYDDSLSSGGLAPHTHFVAVYMPKFHYRYNVTYDQPVDGGATDTTKVPHTVDVAISDKPFTGSKVHEAFLAVDSSGKVYERAYILPSAFEGVAVDKTTGEYLFADKTDATTRVASDFQFGTPSGLTNYANYMLASVNKANAQAPVTNATIADFRQVAENRGGLATQQTFYSWHAINVLFMIYYASTNWQLSTTTGAGVTNLGAGDFNESVSVGYTSAMKNRNGYVSGIARGGLGTTQVPNFKGIENTFGNVWKFLEGYKKLSTGLGNVVKVGIYDKTATNAYDNFDVVDFTEERTIANIPTGSLDYKFRNELMLPTSTTFNNNFYNDRFLSGAGGQTIRSGGDWATSTPSGGFALASSSAASLVSRVVSARLFY